ncbi:MAG: OmpA family protein [Prochloraceae cyanobacterium]|nr:OmpA family protein [Prochloraceae cyanobacterium]
MKSISLNLIARQLLLVSILAILPVGCAVETEEQQEFMPKNTETSTSDRNIVPETDSQTSQPREPIALDNTETDRNRSKDIEIETRSQLRNIETIIYFDFESANLSDRGQEKLSQLARQLDRIDNNAKILVEGHTDDRGSSQYNMEPGGARARSVREFLTSFGIDASVLDTESYGEKQPLVEGSYPEAWSQNRRVEFTIVEPSQASRDR